MAFLKGFQNITKLVTEGIGVLNTVSLDNSEEKMVSGGQIKRLLDLQSKEHPKP
jgi:hypothetical protein